MSANELPRIGVITIQGGGAVAIDLVGQLQGLVGPSVVGGVPTGDAGVAPAAIAGTSAGAIIATLFWLGYNPEEIVARTRELFAPDRIDRFFAGKRLWPGLRFSDFEAFVRALNDAIQRRWLRLLLWPGAGRWFLAPIWFVVQPLRILAGLSVCFLRIAFARGLFPGTGFSDAMDRLVRDSRLVADFRDALPTGRYVTFGDIAARAAPQRLIPLFLIATDIARADMRVVCSFLADDHDVAIASATRASAGFPLFFTPTSLPVPARERPSCCVDGGVVSNFPSWVFAQGYRRSLRRSGDPLLADAAYRPWIHFGLRLPTAHPSDPNSAGPFMKALAGMLTGGARTRLDDKLARTVARRRDVRPTPPAVNEAPGGVLDFSALSNDALIDAAFRRGRGDGQRAVRASDYALPEAARVVPLLDALIAETTVLLGPYLLEAGSVRANVFVPDATRPLLVMRYHANMGADDPDRTMTLAPGQGVTGTAFATGETVLANLRDSAMHAAADLAGGDPFLRRPGAPTIRPDRTWLMSMPVIDLTEAWAETPDRIANPLAPEYVGPILGVLNLDAAVDYDRPGAPSSDLDLARRQPIVRLLSDAMKVAGVRIGSLLAAPLEE